MRTLSTEMQTMLDSGATTLARCWRVQRQDGLVQGFTDHDLPISFDGVSYEAQSGLTSSASDLATGLAADTHEVTGALSSDRISEQDILRGKYDGAEVTVFLVNWQDTETRVRLSRGHIGDITHSDGSFSAEVTGLADQLNQPIGRAFLHSCDCRLGDVKCGIDLTNEDFHGIGQVSALTDPQHYLVEGLDGFAGGWFTGGRFIWTSGANTDLEGHVKVHIAAPDTVTIELWLSPPMPVSVGDTFEVFAGCDKTAKACRQKFENILNFRGFPFMPGDDVASSYPSTGGAHDGGSLFRT